MTESGIIYSPKMIFQPSVQALLGSRGVVKPCCRNS